MFLARFSSSGKSSDCNLNSRPTRLAVGSVSPTEFFCNPLITSGRSGTRSGGAPPKTKVARDPGHAGLGSATRLSGTYALLVLPNPDGPQNARTDGPVPPRQQRAPALSRPIRRGTLASAPDELQDQHRPSSTYNSSGAEARV